ncbi:Rhodanese-like protein [Patellaria atrata CBS 101060]|uniref:Rhodanese-like protein n=1 Tax=Patellaria atrata CBS 101060 TaxID=1346257 RepID=A0A9P4S501_9PEZI|nr:Rhodanese-like protein [Patellaria atrata CBS 101060]
MSDLTIADLTFISREELSKLLRTSSSAAGSNISEPFESTLETTPSDVPQPADATVIAPKDSEIAIIDVRDGDHVGGHIKNSIHAPSSELDYRMPELVRTLKNKDTIVFHCALSQQRGPSAALRYLREKKRLEGKKEGEENGQKVLVLDGGFVKWQEAYGKDKDLTEAYEEDIWKFGY